MRSLPKQFLLRLSQASGVNAAARWALRHSVLVLTYHGVVRRAEDCGPHGRRNIVSCEEFETQLQILTRFFRPISVRDWVAAVDRGTPLPPRSALVTFDDGYRNNLTNAAPLLERYGVPALINVATAYIGADRPLWTDELVYRILWWPRPMLPLPDGPPRALPDDAGQRLTLAHDVRGWCKQIADTKRRAYLDRLREEAMPVPGGEDDEERFAFMTWDEVRTLRRRGFDIGSHTVDHPILSRLEPQEIVAQLRDSRLRIEHEIGEPCRCIAYPSGRSIDVSPEVYEAAAAAGYRLGFMQTPRRRGSPSPLLTVNRVSVGEPLSPDAFHSRLSGVYEAAQHLRQTARRLMRRDAGQPQPAAGVVTTFLTRFEQLEALAPEWERLWRANPRGEIFGTLPWMRAWWRAYGAGRTVCAPAVFDNGRLIGLLPIAREGRVWRFLGTPGADYNDVLSEPGREPLVVRETLRILAARMGPRDRCTLDNIPETSALRAHAGALPSAVRRRLFLRRAAPCPRVEFGADRIGLVASLVAKESLRRHRNKLRRTGALAFRHVVDRDEIRQHLPAFFRQHMCRRAMTGEPGALAVPAARALCESLIDELDPATELRFAVLTLDGAPVAYHLGFELNGKFVWYKPAFNVDFWDSSPGEVLLGALFEYARDRQLDVFDFTGGAEALKYRFANRVPATWALHVYARGVAGWTLHRSHAVREFLKRYPAAFAVVKRAGDHVRARGAYAWRRFRALGALGIVRLIAARTRRALVSRDQVLVYSAPPDSLRPADGGTVPGAEIRPGTLADLARVSLSAPDYLDSAGLARARARLRRGDRVYVATIGGEVVHVNWAGVRTEIVTAEAGASVRIPLRRPVSVAYDAWTSPAFRGRGLFAGSLRRIVADATGTGNAIWLYCRAGNTASRRAIENTGFRVTYRLARLRVLGVTRSRAECIDIAAAHRAHADFMRPETARMYESRPLRVLPPGAPTHSGADDGRRWREPVEL